MVSLIFLVTQIDLDTRSASQTFFFETKGVGNAIFDDGTTLSANFNIEVFFNGTITGILKFQSPDPKMIFQHFEGTHSFTLKGKSDPARVFKFEPKYVASCRKDNHSLVDGGET